MQMRIAITWSLLALAGCTWAESRVIVVPSGTRVTAAPKPPGCNVPVLRNAPSDRPFDELASIHYTMTQSSRGDPVEAAALIRDRACALGADAVLVTQEFVPGGDRPPTMAALAIRFRPASAATDSGAVTR